MAKQSSGHAMDGMQIRKLENQISNMLMDEEIYWKQRSRAEWQKEGDRNTKYFHTKASTRKRKNRIWGVEDNQGQWLNDQKDIDREFSEFFQDLFKTSNPSYVQVQEAVSGLQPKVTSEMNHQLDEPFTTDEIVEVLSQMGPTKAPGLDGLSAAFFQKHWQSTREGVIATCLHILNDKGNLASLNHTHIALVPKVAKP